MAILFMNPWESLCGDCGRSAEPTEFFHITRLGYNPGDGCGAEFTHLSSHYLGQELQEAAQRIRPDLPWIAPGLAVNS